MAAYFGLVKTVEALVDRGAEVNSRDAQVVGPLHLASYQGHVDIIQVLLQRGGLVDRPFRGKSPIYLALAEGQSKAVELLLVSGADPTRKADGRLPFMKAVMDGNARGVQLLLDKNYAHLQPSNEDINLAFRRACYMNEVKIVSLLLQYAGLLQPVDAEREDSDASTQVNDLVQFDINGLITHADHSYPMTAPFMAIVKERLELVSLLIRTGQVDRTMVDIHGRSMLFWALARGYDEIIPQLLPTEDGFGSVSVSSCRLYADMTDKYNATPLTIAVMERNIAAVRLLIHQYDADPYKALIGPILTDDAVRILLHPTSVSDTDIDIVELLLGTGKLNANEALTWHLRHMSGLNIVDLLVGSGRLDVNQSVVEAIRIKRSKLAMLLLRKMTNDVNMLVVEAIKMGKKGNVDLLLHAGPNDINIDIAMAEAVKTGLDVNNAIVWAASMDDPRIAKWLIASGRLDINQGVIDVICAERPALIPLLLRTMKIDTYELMVEIIKARSHVMVHQN